MSNHLKHNPILGIALGLCLADGCILIFGHPQRLMVALLSLLAAGFAFGSFFYKPAVNGRPA